MSGSEAKRRSADLESNISIDLTRLQIDAAQAHLG
jgi:hypothetical protein